VNVQAERVISVGAAHEQLIQERAADPLPRLSGLTAMAISGGCGAHLDPRGWGIRRSFQRPRPSGDDVRVPSLVSPVIAAGSLSRTAQPSIPVNAVAMLRPWLPVDAPALAAAYEDPAIQRWHARRADSVEEAGDWIERWRSGWTQESAGHWAVVEPDTDALLGRVALKALNLEDGTAVLAYWMVAAARGRGLCPESVASLCTWAFREPGFHRIELEHATANAASCRVAVKAGFREEGIRRGAALHADGWHDMHLHARLSHDPVRDGEGP
jgi:[ribosomal protein S5]-alanine N-acetyltransferase